MNDKLQAQLAGIKSSYRPHDEPPKLDELHRERVDKSHCNMVDLAKDVGITYATKK